MALPQNILEMEREMRELLGNPDQVAALNQALQNLIDELNPLITDGDQQLVDLEEAQALLNVANCEQKVLIARREFDQAHEQTIAAQNALQQEAEQRQIDPERLQQANDALQQTQEAAREAQDELQQLRDRRQQPAAKFSSDTESDSEDFSDKEQTPLITKQDQAVVPYDRNTLYDSNTLKAIKYSMQELCLLSLGTATWALQYIGPNSNLASIISFYALTGSETVALGLSIEEGSKRSGRSTNLRMFPTFVAETLVIGGAMQVATNALAENSMDQTIFPPQDLFTGALALLCLKELGGAITSFFPDAGDDKEKAKGAIKAIKSLVYAIATAGVVIALEPTDNPNENVFKYSLLYGVTLPAAILTLLNPIEIFLNEKYERMLRYTQSIQIDRNIQHEPPPIDPAQGVRSGARNIFRHFTKSIIPAGECLIEAARDIVKVDSDDTFTPFSEVNVTHVDPNNTFTAKVYSVPLQLEPVDTFSCNTTAGTCTAETDVPGLQQSGWTFITEEGDTTEPGLHVEQFDPATNGSVTCDKAPVVTIERVAPQPSSSSISSSGSAHGSSSASSSSSSGSTPHQCTITPDPSTQVLGSDSAPIFQHVGVSDITGHFTASVTGVPGTLHAPTGYTCTGDTCTAEGIDVSALHNGQWNFNTATPGATASLELSLENPQAKCDEPNTVNLERGFFDKQEKEAQTSSAAYRSPGVVANTMLALTLGYGAYQLGAVIWDYFSTPPAEPVDKKDQEYFAVQINALSTQLDKIETSLGQLNKSWDRSAFEEALVDHRYALEDLSDGKVDQTKLADLKELRLDINHFATAVNKFLQPSVPIGTTANFFSEPASSTIRSRGHQIEKLSPEAELALAYQ